MHIGSDAWKKHLREGAREMGFSMGVREADQLGVHAVELMRFNRRINLTAIREPLKVAVHHYLDSLAGLFWIPFRCRLLDIGSGGGFPGIPLKVLRPEMELVLIDASRKKVTFLKHAIRTLNLNPVEALHVRADFLVQRPGYAGSFDVVVSRALSSLKEFILTALPLLKGNGRMIAWKSSSVAEEIHMLKAELDPSVFSGIAVQQYPYSLPLIRSERVLVIVSAKKRKHTE
ncbi:MAG: 16S rRNA (guanine(527)-N(7))-methyltransferase RsmG [Deltaproteobacteria bacterium]|nr:16S rRNA (guanine(527)-N(7))-methyltransferase RsmG [Deltaproteobacteria bacterium]